MAADLNLTKLVVKEKMLIGLILAGVVLLVIIFGPTINTFRTRIGTKKSLEKQLVKLEEKKNSLESIDVQLITDRVVKMERIFPSKKPVVELMANLSRLAAEHNLNFGGIKLSPGKLGGEAEAGQQAGAKAGTNPDLHDLTFSFQVSGDFTEISAFMKDLENVAPLMKIESVDLSIKTNPLFEKTQFEVGADIAVAAYYQAPPKSLGPVSQPLVLLTRKDEMVLNKLINFKTFEVVVPVAVTGQPDLFGPDL